ncbi:LacI family DNA-binding transcriptional regulator [Kribbella sandramycini]|uniref:LacI family DNA-binding transcriptional regulator n=1 Tax=Kribbella sandramycini TaxID=60450 RepID=A0A7Y4L314_9ACTN|nr:LacI family DNA-binding transcriptional regulator [Kribbella sandramycini]MBB6571139.1 LacI family transcriptional regulator [Kribbella sandramycini]NOL43453.1 LacI family DNA-binding transcriptional regulator [Kribbella sandramycini]
MTERTRPATLKDVAKGAGVSISTVSRVFSNPGRISPETSERVREVARKLRFTPNVMARSLITGRSPNIGLVVPDITNPYMTTLLKAAQKVSRLHATGVFVADTDDSADIEREVCEQFAQQSRGVILCAPRMTASHIRELSGIVPLVLVNRVVEGIPSVFTDSRAALRELVEELVELGHRRLAYLPGPAGSWSNTQRGRTVADRARALDVEMIRLDPTDGTHADGVAAAEQVLELGVTAVMAFDDVLAAGLVEGLRRSGKSVPDDVSVTGHDDILSELVHPGLTTVTGQSARVGQLAISRLLDGSGPASGPGPESGTHQAESVGVKATVVRRNSTAAPPRSG